MKGYLSSSNREMLIDTYVSLASGNASDKVEIISRLSALPDPDLENELSSLINSI